MESHKECKAHNAIPKVYRVSKMTTQREYIEDIKKRQINSDKEYILDSLTGAIDRLQKAFPRYGSFLMEFVQNADDAKSQSLRIEILQNAIKIFNDGVQFSEEDVKSICKVGRSSKTPKDYIGYLGVGFKAVFLISECPEIYSGDYRFKFDRNAWPDPNHIPWQVIPIWIDTSEIQLPESYKTVFNLSLKTPKLIEKLQEEVRPEHLSDRILLFLRNIKNIEIIDDAQSVRRRIVKSEISKTSDYEIYQIQEYENDALKNQDLLLLFRSVCEVPKEVKEDYITKEWEREKVEKREVLVAFKLDEESNLVREEKGTAHIGVFSFLPLKEIPSGLNFLIQADFLTTPGRGEFARECLWNNWLADEIYNLIISKSTQIFLKHEKWKMNFTEILYPLEGGHELFEYHIKEPLRQYLENEAVLIAEDDSMAKAEELVSIGEEIRELLTNDDLKLLYPNKKIIHVECKPHPNLKIKEVPTDIHRFISFSESEQLIKQKAKSGDVWWFKNIYSKFVEKYNRWYFEWKYYHYRAEHDNFWNRMRDFYRPIILTEDDDLAKINECYINSKKLKIPKQIKDKFKIVHQELVKDEKFEKLRKKLNEERYYYNPPTLEVIRELTEDDIKNAVKRQETLGMDEGKWKKLPDNEKIEEIIHLKDLWSTSYLSLEDYDFLTLKSKDREWVKPEELIFPREYSPEHNIDVLAEKGLFDLPRKFVSPEFIKDNNNDEIRKWHNFLGNLGVDKKLESEKKGGMKEKIVQRIAVLTAMRYEEKERSPSELGESEKPGYDIESKSENEERFIEVKGTSDSSYDIFLTVNELRALRDKRDRYFVYAVLDALREPYLRVTQGNKLLDIPDIKIIIPFAKWKEHAEIEEYKP
jgi:hypothetical protein